MARFQKKNCGCGAALLVLLLGGLSAGPVLAGNMGFLKNSAVGQFSREDVALMQKTEQEALNTAADGQTVEWRNADTGSHGRITPSQAPAGREGCRRVVVENFHDNHTGRDEYVMCKDKETARWLMPGEMSAQDK